MRNLKEREALIQAYQSMTKTELAMALFSFVERLEACEVAIDKMDNSVPPTSAIAVMMEDNRNTRCECCNHRAIEHTLNGCNVGNCYCSMTPELVIKINKGT